MTVIKLGRRVVCLCPAGGSDPGAEPRLLQSPLSRAGFTRGAFPAILPAMTSSSAADILPVMSVAIIGPALIIGAVQSEDALPLWGRITMAVVGVAAIGVGVKAMIESPATGGKGAMDQLVLGAQRELEHTKDPAAAMQIALDHLKQDADYYQKLKTAGL